MNNELIRTNAFVDGAWVEGTSKFSVLNPSTSEEIARVTDSTAGLAEEAVEAAAIAFRSWSRRPNEERANLLRRWRDVIIAHADPLAQLISSEMGKPIKEAISEIHYGASFLQWFAEEARRIYGDILPNSNRSARSLVVKQPIGVCAAITPWNFPVAMLLRKAAPALAAGCTVVVKPAEDTPLSALALAALSEEAELPKGTFNVLPSAQPDIVGRVLATHQKIRKISFTGSTEVGRLLLKQSADTVKKASMELGGNAPFIVFDDAEIEAALDGVIASKFRNGGQTCVCANRIFVHRGIYAEFAEKLAQRVQTLKVGPGESRDTEIGPLINQRAFERVNKLVASALQSGAKLLVGGAPHDLGKLFYAPTVLSDVRSDMEISQAEIFGPVATLIPFDDEEEVVRKANDTIYGLAAYVYTRDMGRAFRVSEELEYGMVGVNAGVISAVEAPFGGVKQSGLGREGSRYGLEDYLEIKYIHLAGMRG